MHFKFNIQKKKKIYNKKYLVTWKNNKIKIICLLTKCK